MFVIQVLTEIGDTMYFASLSSHTDYVVDDPDFASVFENKDETEAVAKELISGLFSDMEDAANRITVVDYLDAVAEES
jgi:hypothetical protein